jgi:hypothetical protein
MVPNIHPSSLCPTKLSRHPDPRPTRRSDQERRGRDLPAFDGTSIERVWVDDELGKGSADFEGGDAGL